MSGICSNLVLGTTSLGQLMQNLESENVSHDFFVEEIFSQGLNTFDAAQSYGSGIEESNLQKLLRNRNRQDFKLMTKVMPREFGSCRNFFNAVQQSLERLKTEYLDTLFIHRPPIQDEKFIEYFEYALTSGVTREIGISNFDSNLIDYFLQSPKWTNFTEALCLSHSNNAYETYMKTLDARKTFFGYSVLRGGVFQIAQELAR